MLQAKRAGPLAAGALAFPGGAAAGVGGGSAGHGPSGGDPRRVPRGRVVSVHVRAVNLELEQGALVALLPEGAPVHPWAVTAPIDPAALRVGDGFAAPDGVLRAGALQVSLGAAEVVDLRLRSRPATLPGDALAGLRRAADEAGLAIPEGPFQSAIASALDRFRAGGEAAQLRSLAGLGGGLTPSGDDALCGVLAGLDLAREARPAAARMRDTLAAALADVVAPGARITTRLSAQMLAAALDGLYAEPVLRLLEALGGDGAAPGAWRSGVAAVTGMGHRSGVDTLLGLVAGLERA